MNSPQCKELWIAETLHSQGQAVDARLTVSGKTAPLNGARVGFQGNLGVGLQFDPVSNAGQQTFDAIR